MAQDWADKTKEIDPKTCRYCSGNSAVMKKDNTYMTSQEWCTMMNTCAATIDWEEVFSDRI